MSTILLVGGTGAMGVYLREILVAEGHDVVITSRSARKASAGMRYVCGNALDESFMKDVLEHVRPDAVVDFMVYGTRQFERRCDMMLQRTKHYLFLSSYRVFNDAPVITENTSRLLESSCDQVYLQTDEYALSKARSEDLLRAAKMRNWTIVRPGITYSRNRFQLGCLEANTLCYRSLQGLPVVMPLAMREKKTTLTWGRDVALMISRLILNPATYGEDYNCATADALKWSEVCELYKDVLKADIRDCTIDEYVYVVGNRAQVLYDRMFDRVIDNRKVLETTGLRQSDLIPPIEGLKKELVEFMNNPLYQYPGPSLNARIDRVTKTRIVMEGMSSKDRMAYYEAYYPALGLTRRVANKIKGIFSR